MGSKQEQVSESPVIVRPDDQDMVERLTRKREEYLGRLGDEFTHPEQAVVFGLIAGSEVQLDAYVKQKLLGEVLEAGSVKAWDFQHELLEDPLIVSLGEDYIPLVVNKAVVACGVIDAYCTGQPVIGGTGLS